MSIQQEFTLQTLTPPDFSSNESLTLEWYVATNFKFVAHRSLLIYQKNQHQTTSSTKTRAEVRGGGRKPWKQKGTGRARAGSSRSPLWRGGGVIFGPKPKVTKLKLNQKEKHVTIRTLLHSTRKNLIVLENFSCFENLSKTREFLEILKRLKNAISQSETNNDTKYLFVTNNLESYSSLKRATKNLKNVQLIQEENLNIPMLCCANQKIILTKAFLQKVN